MFSYRSLFFNIFRNKNKKPNIFEQIDENFVKINKSLDSINDIMDNINKVIHLERAFNSLMKEYREKKYNGTLTKEDSSYYMEEFQLISEELKILKK